MTPKKPITPGKIMISNLVSLNQLASINSIINMKIENRMQKSPPINASSSIK